MLSLGTTAIIAITSIRVGLVVDLRMTDDITNTINYDTPILIIISITITSTKQTLSTATRLLRASVK